MAADLPPALLFQLCRQNIFNQRALSLRLGLSPFFRVGFRAQLDEDFAGVLVNDSHMSNLMILLFLYYSDRCTVHQPRLAENTPSKVQEEMDILRRSKDT
jgi:hypothetical protein